MVGLQVWSPGISAFHVLPTEWFGLCRVDQETKWGRVVFLVLIVSVFILSRKNTPSSQPSPLPDMPWSLGAIAFIFISVKWAQRLVFVGLSGISDANVGAIGVPLITLAGLCIFFFFSLGFQKTRALFGLNHGLGLLQVLFGARWVFIYLSVLVLVSGAVGGGIENFRHGELLQEVKGQWEVWGWLGLLFPLVADALAGPIWEELLYRGMLYSAMRQKISTWPAILITSVIFMLAHGGDRYGAFLLGIFLGLLVEKSHSLLPAIAAHITHNLLAHVRVIPLVLSMPLTLYGDFLLGVYLVGIIGIFLVEVWIRKNRNIPFEWDSVWSVPR